MTLRVAVQMLARCWYVAILGLAVTVGAIVHISTSPGVYWARTTVVFLGPPAPSTSNKLKDGTGSLVEAAGLIARELNGDRPRMPASSRAITLVDQGVYNGSQVRLPNSGGQWAVNFAEPMLDVQAAGPTRDIVQQRMDRMITEITSTLQRRQDEAGVSRSRRITLMMSPSRVQINYSDGDRARATLMAAGLGAALTVAGVRVADALLEARRSRRRRIFATRMGLLA